MDPCEISYDVVVVGAGPAGLSAALNAQRNGLRHLLLEKSDHIADTLFCYQKAKYVMAEPMAIPLQGGSSFRRRSGRISLPVGPAWWRRRRDSISVSTPP